MFDYDLSDYESDAYDAKINEKIDYMIKKYGEDWREEIEDMCPRCKGVGCDYCYMTANL